MYTWCRRMSDRITLQAMKLALYCRISVQSIFELDCRFRQYFQNDSTFLNISPSLYSVSLCDNVELVLLILRLVMLFCHSSYCTMCTIHLDLVFFPIPISPLCTLKNFSFSCHKYVCMKFIFLRSLVHFDIFTLEHQVSVLLDLNDRMDIS